MKLCGWENAHLQFADLDPFDELPHTPLDVAAVFYALQFREDFARHTLFRFGVRTQIQLHLLLCLRKKIERWLVRAEADKDADFFRRLERVRKLTKPTQIKVPDETVKCTCIAAQQDPKAVREA